MQIRKKFNQPKKHVSGVFSFRTAGTPTSVWPLRQNATIDGNNAFPYKIYKNDLESKSYMKLKLNNTFGCWNHFNFAIFHHCHYSIFRAKVNSNDLTNTILQVINGGSHGFIIGRFFIVFVFKHFAFLNLLSIWKWKVVFFSCI